MSPLTPGILVEIYSSEFGRIGITPHGLVCFLSFVGSPLFLFNRMDHIIDLSSMEGPREPYFAPLDLTSIIPNVAGVPGVSGSGDDLLPDRAFRNLTASPGYQTGSYDSPPGTSYHTGHPGGHASRVGGLSLSLGQTQEGYNNKGRQYVKRVALLVEARTTISGFSRLE